MTPTNRDQENIDQQVKELKSLAAYDALMNERHGSDLNPFSTQGARNLWQKGRDGVRPPNLVDGSGDWRHWERGRQSSDYTPKEERAQQVQEQVDRIRG
jgi:hypothetical protein